MKTPEQFVKSIWFREPKDDEITKSTAFEAMELYAKHVNEQLQARVKFHEETIDINLATIKRLEQQLQQRNSGRNSK